MISGRRRILAVVVVTTALCADQAAIAAPAVRPQPAEIGSIAQRLVGRLTENLRRVIPSNCYGAARCSGVNSAQPRLWTPIAALAAAHRPIAPFQFRLPPPIL
jgi:hypothetical protein